MDSFPFGLSEQQYWFLLTASTLLALIGFYFGQRNWRRLRLVEDTATARVRSAHQGYLELEGVGRLMSGVPIVAPLSSTHCLWWRFSVAEKQTTGENDTWRTIRKGVSDSLFHLEDETGQCVIDPDGAEIIGETTRVWLDDSGEYRYTESLILIGQPLYVIGEFRSINPAEQYNVADITRDLIRQWKQDQAALLKRFDGNRDGQIDANEWALVRKVAEVQAQKEFEQRAKQPQIHTLSKPANGERPFILSTHPQQRLTQRYRLWAMGSLTGFFLFGGVAVWLAQFRF